jgi:ketosteroid isomerase-like protein
VPAILPPIERLSLLKIIATIADGRWRSVTAIGHCVTADKDGQREPLDFRLTMGLRKGADGRWVITHEHHSLPAL